MKRMFSVFLLITVWLLVTPFLQAQSHVDKVLKDEITSDLKENILSFERRVGKERLRLSFYQPYSANDDRR